MGFLDKLLGRGKKAAGDVTGDSSLRSEGVHQERAGDAEDRAEEVGRGTGRLAHADARRRHEADGDEDDQHSREDPADPTSGDFDAPEPVRRDFRALAEMQVREPGPYLANAWQEFLSEHRDYLAAEHDRLAYLVKRRDKAGLAEVGRRFVGYRARQPGQSHPHAMPNEHDNEQYDRSGTQNLAHRRSLRSKTTRLL